jgi:hypothetical protein
MWVEIHQASQRLLWVVLQPHDLHLVVLSAAAGPNSMWAEIQQVSRRL